MQKPKNRGRARLFFGRNWFKLRRYLRWWLGRAAYAKKRPDACPHRHFSHATVLLRRLKDVDMALQVNKITNLRLAAEKLNGVVLRPGESFSYWRLIGKPTRRKGYLPGMVLQNGRYYAGIGGGLCQLSNLLYWMALHTPLTVTERHRHGYDVFPDAGRTQPFGSGATCFYNYIDLCLRNDTPDTYRIRVQVGDENLEGAIFASVPPAYRFEVYQKEHLMRLEAWGGYTRHNAIWRRKFALDGALLEDAPVTENHAVMMYAPLLSQTGSTGGQHDLE